MKKINKFLFPFLSLTLASPAFAHIIQEDNIKIVKDFYEMAFNQHKPTEAAMKYFGKKYIQHNPQVPNGAKAFYSYFEGFFGDHPQYYCSIKRTFANDDLVALHMHCRIDEKDLGQAVLDIFRVENGKIVEHWDVIQNVPEKSANENTMF